MNCVVCTESAEHYTSVELGLHIKALRARESLMTDAWLCLKHAVEAVRAGYRLICAH